MITDWSHPTWELLHVIACMLVKDNKDVRSAFGLVKTMLRDLPCGVCTSHATEQLSRQTHPITTPAQLRVAMWQFHNGVNRLLGKQLYPWGKYQKRYGTQETVATIRHQAAPGDTK